MRAITEQSGGLFFIDAPGGTGKTFLLSLILATIQSQNNIALAIASSGIAATLLDGGRTTHSALKLPLNLQNTEAPTCNISKNSGMRKVLQTCQIIIWDECTMSHKKALEALDRTLRDFRGNRRIFGGALISLSGDFRQTLPIIPRSTPADELHACLKSSVLWRHLQKLTLKTNMRVQLQRGMHRLEILQNNSWILEMGEWKLMNLPANFCKITESIDELLQKFFPNIAQNYKNHQWLSTRAILAAKNIDVNTINFTIQHGIPSETTTYKSIDTVENQDEVVNYPTEFLNSLDLPGMPPHVLTLKIGVPIILLRNINSPRLCNGTRLCQENDEQCYRGNNFDWKIQSDVYKKDKELVQSAIDFALVEIKNKRLDSETKLEFERIKLAQFQKQLELANIQKNLPQNSDIRNQSVLETAANINVETLLKSVKTLTIPVPSRVESCERVNNLLVHVSEEELNNYITGSLGSINENKVHCGLIRDEDLNKNLEKFWKLEEVEKPIVKNKERLICEEHYANTHFRTNEGKYVVSMPLKKEPSCLGNSKDIALKRLGSLWNRLARDENYLNLYREFLRDYERLGHMKEVTNETEPEVTYYATHHGIYRP
ncbi:ATP-dependent DNA helicase [Trichonephila clavipes]|nr:ATP-dependent DNA helicase [Trichonephila clavipes]